MQPAGKIIDFQEHLFNKDIDSRIKTSRDDTLKIIQADIKRLDEKFDVKIDSLASSVQADIEVLDVKIDSLASSVQADIEVLHSKVDKNFEVLNTKIEALDCKADKNFELLNAKFDNAISMRKWVVGMFITVLLGVAALVGPNVIAFFT